MTPSRPSMGLPRIDCQRRLKGSTDQSWIALESLSMRSSSEKVEPSHIRAYARSVAPLLLKNVAFAAKLELDSLHRQVMTWKKRMSRSVWKSLYVLICAGHRERYRETTKQYFQRLVGEKNSFDARFENRVIYAESIRDIPAALDLLARHIVDQEASVVFFDHATRLQRILRHQCLKQVCANCFRKRQRYHPRLVGRPALLYSGLRATGSSPAMPDKGRGNGERIETESKIRKWFQDLTRLST